VAGVDLAFRAERGQLFWREAVPLTEEQGVFLLDIFLVEYACATAVGADECKAVAKLKLAQLARAISQARKWRHAVHDS
jgi:hypothetical protein